MGDGLQVVWQTGKTYYEQCKAAWIAAGSPKNIEVLDFLSDMPDRYAQADLVISRAGASSIAEIAALAVPSMLVPYPFATADHQTTNACYLVDAGAAVMLADDAIDTPAFAQELLSLVDDAARRDEMRERARGLAQDQAASVLADQVEAAAQGR
jgi:UDP-N-acetylglucosamine--N-acetylmuramyl-(pentapeptide) pyrophosphoryl-undecaprenol N-acetylglucosamine transferase